MKKSLALGLATAMTMAAAGSAAHAATFASAPIAPEQGLGGLTRSVAREFTGRAVFAQPWATVTLSHLDLYDRMPYVESRQFQIVSDPTWNRLVAGEIGHGLVACNGAGGPGTRQLNAPHGLAVDERDRVYVADTGNDRVVVLQAHTEFEQITFTPLYTIDGLSAPYDVAYSDGGTPFDAADDAIVVANTGRNEIVAYALEANGARRTAALGALGSGDGEFAGPTAIAFGRESGANTGTVYVADAHNRRIAQVTLRGGVLRWAGAAGAGADVVTSLDTDHWGNVYAAAPQQGLVRKFNRALEPVAELRGAVARPRSFRIPFTTVRDHRDGSVTRRGQASALSLDTWADDRGLALWNLGVSVEQLAISGGTAPRAQFVLTDPADVAIEVTNPATGQVTGRRALGTLDAGAHDATLSGLLSGDADAPNSIVRVTATARYTQGATATAQATFGSGGAGMAPAAAALLGHWPNPVRESANIAFALPAGLSRAATLDVYDAQGRHVRALGTALSPGTHHVTWDGHDDAGAPVRAGVYWYRLEAPGVRLGRRIVVVR